LIASLLSYGQRFYPKLENPLFRGLLGLSNGISPSQIDCFLVEICPNECPQTHKLVPAHQHFHLPEVMPEGKMAEVQ